MPSARFDQELDTMYDVIVDFWRSNGYGPSIRDLCHLLGLSSTSVADYRARELRRRNRIAYNEERSRTIRPMEFGEWWSGGRPIEEGGTNGHGQAKIMPALSR